MSFLLRTASLVVAIGLLGACSGGESGSPGTAQTLDSASPESAPESAPESDSPDSPGSSGSPDSNAEATACDQVVAGIEAFNRGEFDRTVDSFEQALPLAEDEDEAADTRRSADLLEAVRYYAELAPEDYLEASVNSTDFAKYKAITLGQCGSGQPQVPGEPEDDGVLA